MYKYLLLTAITFTYAFLHPIHVSICEIEYDKNNKALEMTLRIFIDDLEKEIRLNRNEPELDITNLPDGHNLDDILKEYLNRNFQVGVNDKDEEYTYLGHEIEGDAIFCYMEIPKVKRLKSIEVYYAVLTQLYEDQTNLVHVEVDDKIRSMKMTKSEVKDKIVYE